MTTRKKNVTPKELDMMIISLFNGFGTFVSLLHSLGKSKLCSRAVFSGGEYPECKRLLFVHKLSLNKVLLLAKFSTSGRVTFAQ